MKNLNKNFYTLDNLKLQLLYHDTRIYPSNLTNVRFGEED